MINENTIYENGRDANSSDIEQDKEENSRYKPEEFEKWDDLKISSNLLRGIYAYGFETPSPIQKKSIKTFIDKKDLIAQAQSGTGKTGTFSIACLQMVDPNINNCQVICLSPTREIAN